tara:strand:+ start:176 stop:493 length:318 start_codon:yes stop_codon:yes gene_type:complete
VFNRKHLVDPFSGQQQDFVIQHEQQVLIPFGGLNHGIHGCGAVTRGDPDYPVALDRWVLVQSLLDLFTTEAVQCRSSQSGVEGSALSTVQCVEQLFCRLGCISWC